MHMAPRTSTDGDTAGSRGLPIGTCGDGVCAHGQVEGLWGSPPRPSVDGYISPRGDRDAELSDAADHLLALFGNLRALRWRRARGTLGTLVSFGGGRCMSGGGPTHRAAGGR